ncbi:MAG: cyclic nucleotide-binding domain-containing protein, partial [Candidatus Latescibacterota bacterium]|nr:cyclic nucleotide-binding domain-containing protein [Candidatus Latescibacterota bacterium]
IKPVAPVGEMGMLTRQPCSATVRAHQRSTVLSLRKAGFEVLMRKHLAISRQVHQNVLTTLAARVVDSQQNHDTQLKSLQSLRRRLEAARAEFASLLRTDG